MAKKPGRVRRRPQVSAAPSASENTASVAPEEPASAQDNLDAARERLGERFQDVAVLGDLASDVGTLGLVESMLSKCLRLFRCRCGSVFLYRPESEELELMAVEGPMREALLGIRQRLGVGVAGKVAERKQGIFVPDITQSAEFTPHGSMRYQTNSFACVPIIHRGELLGILSLTDKETDAAFDASDVGSMLAIARFSAGAISQCLQQERLRGFNIELHRRLDTTIDRLQSANQELTRLKNFNESLLTSMALAIVAFDDQLHVTFYNESARALFHLGAAEEVDRNIMRLNVDCDGMAWQDVLHAVVKEGRAVSCGSAQYTVETPGARRADVRVLSISASPLRGAGNRVIGGVVAIGDVTDRVRMEKRLAASERHAVIGKLAARVAHELNNPLDGILRFINLSINLKGKEDPTREYLVECKKGLERMVGIVSSLLEFSRSTYPLHRDTRLNEVITEAVRTLRHRAEQQKIKVTLDFQPDLPEMKCGELVQVFINLIKNAYDAMKGGGELRITTRLEAGSVRITVTDTGCGMPPEVLERAFAPFFTTKGPGEGTGLGLAISHDIIEKHGGSISVESKVGVGSTFTITLPVT